MIMDMIYLSLMKNCNMSVITLSPNEDKDVKEF